jgi:AcrR family transcriptional regulator
LSKFVVYKLDWNSNLVNSQRVMTVSVQTREVREAILDATDRMLAQYGYKKMTIDDLAAEVGIGKGSIYLHFTSKEEIALSHIDRIIERLKERLVATAKEEINSAAKLQKMLLTRVLFRFDSVQHYTQSLNDILAAIRPKLLARRRKYFAEEAEIFAHVIEKGQSGGDFREGDSLELAETFLLATNSLLPFSLTTKELGERDEIEEKTLRLADLLLTGLEKN